MNIGTRLMLSAALAVGSTIGAAALGQSTLKDSQAEVAQPRADDDRSPAGSARPSVITTNPVVADAERLPAASVGAMTAEDLSTQPLTTITEDTGSREDAVRQELLAAAAAGDISWEAAERVIGDLSAYIRGERRADVV